MSAPARSSSSSSAAAAWRKALLVPPLLFALYLLTDDEVNAGAADEDAANPQRPPPLHHLAVLTALRRHPPSLRVFRALSELTLLLLCAAFSLWVWERKPDTIGPKNVGRLLFDHPRGLEEYEIEFEEGRSVTSGTDGQEQQEEGGQRRASYSRYESARSSETEGYVVGGDAREYYDEEEDDDEDDFASAEEDDEGIEELKRHLQLSPIGRTDAGVPISACDAASGRLSEDEMSETRLSEPLPMPPLHDAPTSDPYPPSAASVLSAALDLLLLLLVCLFLFTLSSAEGGRYIDHMSGGVGGGEGGGAAASAAAAPVLRTIGDVAAPIFPLVLFFAASAMAVLPWRRRRAFWTVMSYTFMAPYHEVTFRDGFVGDIFTSAVRPLQDLAFTVFYLASGLQGWWTAGYGIDDAAAPVERSWLLHTVVLPGCMVSPLWWRFLQNLRQCHDAKRRWPYLGNALKYFVAAEVALFGVFAPNARQHFVWILCFTGATLYQVWWDVFMDWELLVYRGGNGKGDVEGAGGNIHPSYRRRSRWRWPFELRPTRLYSSKWTYRLIFVVNFLLRFCWTLSFIPRSYLSRTGSLVDAFGADFQTFVGPALASAEIIRRTLWGLLRVELETIKTTKTAAETANPDAEGDKWGNGAYDLSGRKHEEDEGATMMARWDDEDLQPMSIGGASGGPLGGRFGRMRGALGGPYAVLFRSDMSAMTDAQIMGELCLYGTAFTSLGILAAAHRQVM